METPAETVAQAGADEVIASAVPEISKLMLVGSGSRQEVRFIEAALAPAAETTLAEDVEMVAEAL